MVKEMKSDNVLTEKFVQEQMRTPIAGSFDVIVCGGGPTGVAAAISAARHQQKVLIIEAYGFFGGMWTAGMVSPFFDYENKGGICREIVEKIDARKQSVQNGPKMWVFDVEEMKLLLDELITQEQVEVLFHTQVVAPVQDGDTVRGVIVENKGGRSAYLAKIVIDATGDADIAARAGAPFQVGNQNGAVQPMTLMFRISNHDYIQDYYNYPHYSDNELIHMIDDELERRGIRDYDFNYRRPCVLKVPGEHTSICQTVHIRNRLSTNPVDLTQAELEGRREVQRVIKLLRLLPQFEHMQLDETGPHIGIRESRRITGEYILTEEDIKQSRRFPDGICYTNYWVDIHQADGVDQEHQRGAELQPDYQIPYRCLVPLKIENLLVAGRCISGTEYAMASYRVTGNCTAMGQAAGVAAALCNALGCTPRSLPHQPLIEALRADGVNC